MRRIVLFTAFSFLMFSIDFSLKTEWVWADDPVPGKLQVPKPLDKQELDRLAQATLPDNYNPDPRGIKVFQERVRTMATVDLIYLSKVNNRQVYPVAIWELAIRSAENPEAFQELLNLAGDENFHFRAQALYTIKSNTIKRASPGQSESLVRSLKSRNENVRWAGLITIAKIESLSPNVLEAFITAIKSQAQGTTLSPIAATTHRNKLEPEILAALIDQAENGIPPIRSEAGVALYRQVPAHPELIPVIFKAESAGALFNQKFLSYHGQSVEQLTSWFLEQLNSKDSFVKTKSHEFITTNPALFLTKAIEITKNSNPDISSQGIMLIRDFLAHRASETYKPIIREISQASPNMLYYARRLELAELLVQKFAPTAVLTNALVHLLTEEPHASQVSKMADSSPRERILQVLHKDLQISSEIDRTFFRLLGSEDPQVRHLAEELFTSRNISTDEALVALKSGEPAVKTAAAKAIGSLRNWPGPLLDALLHELKKSADLAQRRLYIGALGGYRSPNKEVNLLLWNEIDSSDQETSAVAARTLIRRPLTHSELNRLHALSQKKLQQPELLSEEQRAGLKFVLERSIDRQTLGRGAETPLEVSESREIDLTPKRNPIGIGNNRDAHWGTLEPTASLGTILSLDLTQELAHARALEKEDWFIQTTLRPYYQSHEHEREAPPIEIIVNSILPWMDKRARDNKVRIRTAIWLTSVIEAYRDSPSDSRAQLDQVLQWMSSRNQDKRVSALGDILRALLDPRLAQSPIFEQELLLKLHAFEKSALSEIDLGKQKLGFWEKLVRKPIEEDWVQVGPEFVDQVKKVLAWTGKGRIAKEREIEVDHILIADAVEPVRSEFVGVGHLEVAHCVTVGLRAD